MLEITTMLFILFSFFSNLRTMWRRFCKCCPQGSDPDPEGNQQERGTGNEAYEGDDTESIGEVRFTLQPTWPSRYHGHGTRQQVISETSPPPYESQVPLGYTATLRSNSASIYSISGNIQEGSTSSGNTGDSSLAPVHTNISRQPPPPAYSEVISHPSKFPITRSTENLADLPDLVQTNNTTNRRQSVPLSSRQDSSESTMSEPIRHNDSAELQSASPSENAILSTPSDPPQSSDNQTADTAICDSRHHYASEGEHNLLSYNETLHNTDNNGTPDYSNLQSEAGASRDNISSSSQINIAIHQRTQSAETSTCDSRTNSLGDEEGELPSYSEAILSISSNSTITTNNDSSPSTPIFTDAAQVNHVTMSVSQDNATMVTTNSTVASSSTPAGNSAVATIEVQSTRCNPNGDNTGEVSTDISESSTTSEVSTDSNCVTDTDSEDD